MKKITLTIILACCCISMSFSFRGCNFSVIDVINAFRFVAGGSSNIGLGDNGTSETFIIGVGLDGAIIKSTGEDTIIFTSRNSGTTQTLNYLRIQSTTFQPGILAVGNNGTITRSTDLGETWTVAAPVTSANLYGSELNSSSYYAVGDNGTVIMSYTGISWTVQTSTTIRNLKAVGMHANAGGTVIAVGDKGTIIRTTNSGQNWSNISISDTSINFYCISQRTRQNLNATNFYIAGSQGKIYKSTDMGVTWVLKNSGTTNTLRSIYFSGNDSGAVTGDNGTVKMTTDAGETWFTDAVFNGVSGSVQSISKISRSSPTFTALSENGLYIISEDPPFIGLNNIGTAVPEYFSLYQNYPNPFNPSTKISFELPKSSFAKLIVYDITGKEIKTLVNENLRAGAYEYEWDGINIPSGVYFYKLIAGDYSETRKMVLVK